MVSIKIDMQMIWFKMSAHSRNTYIACNTSRKSTRGSRQQLKMFPVSFRCSFTASVQATIQLTFPKSCKGNERGFICLFPKFTISFLAKDHYRFWMAKKNHLIFFKISQIILWHCISFECFQNKSWNLQKYMKHLCSGRNLFPDVMC